MCVPYTNFVLRGDTVSVVVVCLVARRLVLYFDGAVSRKFFFVRKNSFEVAGESDANVCEESLVRWFKKTYV